MTELNCRVCGKIYKKQGFLTKHENTCKATIKCECGKTFASERALKIHMNSHKLERVDVCRNGLPYLGVEAFYRKHSKAENLIYTFDFENTM